MRTVEYKPTQSRQQSRRRANPETLLHRIMGTVLQGAPAANFRAGGRTESGHQGKEVSESHCRRAAARKAFLSSEIRGPVLRGDGAAQEGGLFYIKV